MREHLCEVPYEKRGLYCAFLDVKLHYLKCQYCQKQSFLHLPKAALLASIWYILHPNKRLDQEGFVVFKLYFNCIFWSMLSWQRKETEESQKVLRSSVDLHQALEAFLLSAFCGDEKGISEWRGEQCFCVSFVLPLPCFLSLFALAILTLFFLSDSCLSNSP